MICDIFALEAVKYAIKHKVKYIINVGLSYNFVEVMFNRPNFKNSFGIGGLTFVYPPLFNVNLILGFQDIVPYLCTTKVLVNTAIGL